jgi:hypothetical protein
MTTNLTFNVTYADLPSDVLAVGRPSPCGLELVLPTKADDGPDDAVNARFWRDKALEGVAKHLMAVAVVSTELGSPHEVEAFIVTEQTTFIASAIHELAGCLNVVGVAPV